MSDLYLTSLQHVAPQVTTRPYESTHNFLLFIVEVCHAKHS